jgi:predicted NBD/HSP70 family sugar kinase
VLDQAAALVSVALHDLGVQPDRLAAVGVSLPAPVDPSSGLPLSRALLPSWAGVGVGAELATRLGTRVTVDNDANLETLAEWRHGAGAGSEDLIYVKLSHGIGAGLVLGGRLRRGAAGMAGELGHVRVRDDGVVCRCGNRGCLGTVASVTALIELLRGIHGPDLDLDGVLALLGRGDAGARRTVADAGRALGMALGTLCNLVNPELIVVGGELSGDESPLLDGVREGIDRYAVPAAAEAVTVRAGALGRRAVLLGAVTAALEESDSTQAAAVAAS